MRLTLICILLAVMLVACDGLAAPTATPTATPTALPSDTPTAPPTATATPTNTATATASPTVTNTPTNTPTATITPTPSNTPLPTPELFFDNLELLDIPEDIRDGIDQPLVAFININNSETIRNLSTAQPTTDNETLYYSSPNSILNRVPILELDATTGDQIFISPRGNGVAYFVGGTPSTAGLYVLNVAEGISGRALAVDSLVQRGIFSEPSWRPDGSVVATVVETGYDLDILGFDVASSDWVELVRHGAFDFWPRWSPDGRYLAFVSDRETCPSWQPGVPDACNLDDDPIPSGGHLFVLDTNTGETFQVSEQVLTEPPRWINNQQIVFTGGDRLDLLNQSRTIWVAAMTTRSAREIRLQDGPETPLYLSPVWSPDGSQIVFQNVDGDETEIVIMDTQGNRLSTLDDISFARFTMSAAWGPDAERLAIGGSGGQCPYGVRVYDEAFDRVAAGNPPPTMCEPVFSPDGRSIAFTGVNPNRADGRVDVYTSSANGFDQVNLTVDLRGQMELLGWVGP